MLFPESSSSHRNTAVRKVTAQFLVSVVERMGPGKILCGVKDVTDRILPTVSQFVVDGSQETRSVIVSLFSMICVVCLMSCLSYVSFVKCVDCNMCHLLDMLPV